MQNNELKKLTDKFSLSPAICFKKLLIHWAKCTFYKLV